MVAGIALLGTGTQRTGRGRNRRARLSLVGTNNQRTGNLHGRRDTEDCRRVKLGLHIDIVNCKLQRLGALQFREDFATSNFCFCVGIKLIRICNS